MLASDVLTRAQDILQDVMAVRWPFPELCRWLNDGQRDAVVQKPSANSKTAALQIAAGPLQELGAQYVALLRPVRNLEAGIFGRAVTVVSKDLMDAQAPNWYAQRPAKVVKHLMFDEANPRTFYVYPPNDGNGLMETVVSVLPPVIAATGNEELPESYRVELALRDEYMSAMVDYVLYRAYSKDSQVAAAASRAQLHYQLYAGALGIKLNVETTMSPNIKAGVARAAGGVEQG